MTRVGYSLLPSAEIEQSYAYGFAHYAQGNYREAADIFRILCTRRPLEARFWFGLGATLQQGESYSEALHAWAMTALLSTKDPFPHFHAAECYLSLKEISEAGKALREAASKIEGLHPLKEKIQLLEEQWKL